MHVIFLFFKAPLLTEIITLGLTALGLASYPKIQSTVSSIFKELEINNRLYTHVVSIFIYVLIVFIIAIGTIGGVISFYYTTECSRQDRFDSDMKSGVQALSDHLKACPDGKYANQVRDAYSLAIYEKAKACIKKDACSSSSCIKTFQKDGGDSRGVDQLDQISKDSDITLCQQGIACTHWDQLAKADDGGPNSLDNFVKACRTQGGPVFERAVKDLQDKIYLEADQCVTITACGTEAIVNCLKKYKSYSFSSPVSSLRITQRLAAKCKTRPKPTSSEGLTQKETPKERSSGRGDCRLIDGSMIVAGSAESCHSYGTGASYDP